MAPHSSTLAWRIPRTEESGRPQPTGCEESDTTERFHFHFESHVTDSDCFGSFCLGFCLFIFGHTWSFLLGSGFSHCGELGLLFLAVRKLLIVVGSPVVTCGPSSCGCQAVE